MQRGVFIGRELCGIIDSRVYTLFMQKYKIYESMHGMKRIDCLNDSHLWFWASKYVLALLVDTGKWHDSDCDDLNMRKNKD